MSTCVCLALFSPWTLNIAAQSENLPDQKKRKAKRLTRRRRSGEFRQSCTEEGLSPHVTAVRSTRRESGPHCGLIRRPLAFTPSRSCGGGVGAPVSQTRRLSLGHTRMHMHVSACMFIPAELACESLAVTRSTIDSASRGVSGSTFARASRINTCPHLCGHKEKERRTTKREGKRRITSSFLFTRGHMDLRRRDTRDRNDFYGYIRELGYPTFVLLQNQLNHHLRTSSSPM